jgi:hypothetical protein
VVVFALTLLAVSVGLKFFDARRKKQMTDMLHTAAGRAGGGNHNLLKEIEFREALGIKALLASLHFTRHAQEQIQQAGLNWSSTRLLTSHGADGDSRAGFGLAVSIPAERLRLRPWCWA